MPRFGRPADPRGRRAHVLGCEIDRVDMREALRRCESYVTERSSAQHMAVNAAKIVLSRRDIGLQRLINDCELITADGQAVVWASRLLGDPLPARVTGIDLMDELLALADRRSYRVFILGSRPEVLSLALARLRARHPRLAIAGARHGYFSEQEEPQVVAEIRSARPDLLFVALPTPRKEYFLGRWRSRLDVPLSMGVGGAIDVLAGETKRAPQRLQRLGLEWAVRAVQEPRRLGKRYMITNSAFMWLTLRGAVRRRHGSRPHPAGTGGTAVRNAAAAQEARDEASV
jgi:N-acetylglucosaminyldiphosphoundecaprenol N-acetyl-beta-D-mannosaminyltransferase